MFVLRLTYLLIGLSFSFVFSWQVAMDYQLQPIQFLGIGSANANEGGEGGGNGGGSPPPTIINVSLESFLALSRSELIHLRKLNFREDTRVVIEGFRGNALWNGLVLGRFIDSTNAARRFIRALRGVYDNTQKRNIIAEHRALAAEKKALLAREVRLTIDQIDQEYLVSGHRVEENLRLRTLRQTLEEQRLRLRAAERFESFLWDSWRHTEFP
jgi:hypothetical protein